MIKEFLKDKEPIVYHALQSAIQENRISSAWLFTGPYGTPKYEAAILLAQSILCEQKGSLACEECNTCRRVKEHVYADMMVLDGRENTISKDMVDAIQEKFSKTALEKNGQKVYIIRNIENATIAAQNSLLKFLEEPAEDVTAILTSDNWNRILPTIVSRCTVLPFLPMPQEYFIQMAVEVGFSKEEAYLVSHIVREKEDLAKLWDEDADKPSILYEHIKMMFCQFLNVEGEESIYLSTDFETTYLSSSKDNAKAKLENRILLCSFFDLLILYAKDCLQRKQEGPLWYQKAVQASYKEAKYYADLIRIAAEQKDLCNRYNDLSLVFYQTLFRLEGCNA